MHHIYFCCTDAFWLCFSFACAYTTAEEAIVHCNEPVGPIWHRFCRWLSTTSWWQCCDPSLTFLCHSSFHHLPHQFTARLFWTGPFVNTSEQWFSWGQGHCCQGTYLTRAVWYVLSCVLCCTCWNAAYLVHKLLSFIGWDLWFYQCCHCH